jgi:hypothetical protein
MVRFMQTPIFVPPSADRRVSVSAAKPILHLNVWMNPVLQYVDLERRQVQSNPLPAAGITRKQNLESCGVATLEFALRSQKLLLRPKPAGHINGNFPNGWLVHFRNVALASQKFPGQRGIRKSPSGTLEVALLGDGVAPENLYPLDVDRALDKLDTIKDQILWWETGAQLQQQLADGEVALSSAWNGRVQKEIDAGVPVEIQWNQNLQTADYLVVPKGTAHKEEAMRLIAYCVSGQNNHRLSEYIEYAPINKESIPKVDPQVASRLPTAHREVSVTYNAEWWDNNREAVTKRFNEWVTS